jgi:hypothetical protein
MDPYFAHLRLPIDVDAENLARFDCDPDKLGITLVDNRKLPANLHAFLREHGIRVSHAEAFHTPPNSVLPIHIDGESADNHAKLNFVYGASGSEMAWWKLKDERAIIRPGTNAVGKNYVPIFKQDCNMVATTRIGLPTLVNVGTPHSVHNPTQERRWCLSLVLFYTAISRPVCFAPAKMLLKNYVVSK